MIDASIALLKCVIDYGLCIWAFSWFAKRKSENRALFLGSIFLSSLFLFGINMLEIPWLNTIVSAFTLLVLFLVVFYTRWQQAFPPRAGRICQPIHLNESLSRAAFTAAIPLNDCSLKGDALELGHLEGDISGSGGEIAVVVAAAIPLTLLITLIPGSLGQLVGLRLQQFVERLLYTASYEFFELPLDYFLV